MFQSMTGYGKASGEFGSKQIRVEIRSLNGKQLDIYLKSPFLYREKEQQIRSELSQKLQRGKVDVSIHVINTNSEPQIRFNTKLAQVYFSELRGLAETIGESGKNTYLPLIINMPDVLQQQQQELSEEEWAQFSWLLNNAIIELVDFRTREGAVLEKDIGQRIQTILGLLAAVEKLEPQRISAIREKLCKGLHEIKEQVKVDNNRFEQELIYYMEKLDISEEKLRLRTHCEYFLKTACEETMQGRKLGFIVQEIGREINTIGSKANDAGIQKLVVQMKDELEKIKEQLLNVL